MASATKSLGAGGEEGVHNRLIRLIAVDKIFPSPFQPRKHFDEARLDELARSGELVTPIIVRPLDKRAGTFEIIAGERRWRAYRLKKQKEIPCIIRELSDDQARYMVLIDNILREDLSPIEEAEAVAQLVKLSGNRKEAVAERLGKGVTYVADRVAILALPEEVKRMLDERKLNVTQAKVILEIKGKQGRLDAARLAARLSLTATDLRARVQRSLSPSSPGEAGARVRSLSFSELSGGVVRLYDAFERFDLDSITDHQARITFRKQVRLLYSSLVRAQNELSRGLEPDEEGEE